MKEPIVFKQTGRLRSLSALALVAVAVAFSINAQAQSTETIEARYKLDVQRCHQGDSAQDLATCLREAAAARTEARNNLLTDHDAAFRQNQLLRCQSLPPGQREDCLKQMEGTNTQVMGSVEAGGVLRETTIITPGKIIVPGTAGPETAPAVNSQQTVQTLPVR